MGSSSTQTLRSWRDITASAAELQHPRQRYALDGGVEHPRQLHCHLPRSQRWLHGAACAGLHCGQDGRCGERGQPRLHGQGPRWHGAHAQCLADAVAQRLCGWRGSPAMLPMSWPSSPPRAASSRSSSPTAAPWCSARTMAPSPSPSPTRTRRSTRSVCSRCGASRSASTPWSPKTTVPDEDHQEGLQVGAFLVSQER